MLKKMLAVILAVAMVLGMSFSVYAADPVQENPSENEGNEGNEGNDGNEGEEDPSVDSVWFSYVPSTITVGSTFTVTLKVEPKNVKKQITWKSSDEKVVKINESGTDSTPVEGIAICSLTALSPGEAEISATIDGITKKK
jgi:hypothetical protein